MSPKKRSTDNSVSRVLPKLLISRPDAERQINDRIAIGETLKARQVTSLQSIDSLRSDYQIWSDFNGELLGRIFDTDVYKNEYCKWFASAISLNPTPQEQYLDIVRDIEDKLQRLRSLIPRLQLIQDIDATLKMGAPMPPIDTVTPNLKRVFIIHGRNSAARVAVEHFVRSLDLQPIDFDELAADLGGSAFVGDIVREGLKQAQGIIALFTPDEFAALRTEHRGAHDKPEDIQRWQARPNVIFEAGMAYGMAPERTVLVTLGTDVALFSDVSGVHVVRLTNQSNSRSKLRQKLIGMGCDINLRSDRWADSASAGDFETCIKLSGGSPRDPF